MFKSTALLYLLPSVASAFCPPPEPPPLTSEVLAREFRKEMREDFETYFSDANHYFKCIDRERDRIKTEINETAARYDRFLRDSATWD